MESHWTKSILKLEGIDFHISRTGDGNKPALVLAHGFSDHGLCWTSVAQFLEADFDVILPDARGHGRSARVAEGESLDLARDLHGIIRALDLNRPIVAGHSMGAATALDMASRFPGTARALLLEDPPWRQGGPTPNHGPLPGSAPWNPPWIQDLKALGEAELLAKCHRDHPGWSKTEASYWVESKIQFDPGFLQATRSPRQEWTAALATLDIPALLVMGDPEKGALVTPAVADQARHLLPKIRCERIPESGHVIHRDQLENFLGVFRGFLKELSP